MSAGPLVSLIVTSCNYDRFLAGAIDSALGQTYPNVEVIVVDDGSSDDSRRTIAHYGTRVVPILKDNGGMASAINAGLGVARGDIVGLMDADDTLAPEAVDRAVPLFEPGVAKVHWQLRVVDAHGRPMGSLHPSGRLSEGDLRERVLRWGDAGYTWPVTTGNAWSRAFLERVRPIPVEEYRFSAESYLATLAPAFGTVRAIREPLGTYRLHPASLSNQRTVTEAMRMTERRHLLLGTLFERAGFHPDIESWAPDAATRRDILAACEEIERVIPHGSEFLFVEWEQWGPGQVVAGARAIPFPERDGRWGGRPADDREAIAELERLRRAGAAFIVFARPALWWLEHYAGFARFLRGRFACRCETGCVTAFDLRSAVGDPA